MAEYGETDAALFTRHGFDMQEVFAFYGAAKDEPLPGPYAAPDGGLYLATVSGKSAGSGAFHRLGSSVCEMKRLYVRSEFRGMHIGRALVKSLIAAARASGYGVMRLETTTLELAPLALYASMGFQYRDPYYVIPPRFHGIMVFMELKL